MTPQWDWNIGLRCTDCGQSLWEDSERAFSFAPHEYLCCDCATQRGGIYDPAHQVWTVPPSLEGARA